MKPDFSEVDPYVLIRAQTVGKLTENYCYRLMLGQPVTVRSKHCGSLQPDVAARVQAFYRWMERYKPVYVDHQSYVWSEEDRIAWIRDLRVRIKNELWLIDIKCTSSTAKDWPLQLGCGLSYDENHCEKAAILQLKPSMNRDGYKFRDQWRAAQLKDWWGRAVQRWHSNHDFNLLRNDLGYDSEAMGFEVEE